MTKTRSAAYSTTATTSLNPGEPPTDSTGDSRLAAIDSCAPLEQNLLSRDAYMTVKDVKDLTGVSNTTLLRWQEKNGHFPKRGYFSPARPYYLKSEVEAWVKARLAARESHIFAKR